MNVVELRSVPPELRDQAGLPPVPTLFQQTRSYNNFFYDEIFTNEIFLNFAHGFLTLKRKFLPHSFTAKIQLPVKWPTSGLDLLNF